MQETGRAALLTQVVGLVVIALSISSSASTQTSSGISPTSVAISYSLPAHQLTLHQPVIVKFHVNNGASQPISLDLGQDRKASFSFTVAPPNGVKLELAKAVKEGAALSGKVLLAPGDSYNQNLVLNEWYDFPVPGKYQLSGYLTQPIVMDDGSGYQKDSGFRLSIEIGSEDELALTKICDALANQIDASSSYAQAIDPALALSYVNDPIAVAYLRRGLFAHKLVEPIVILGLERIANGEAVQALAEGLKADPSDSVRFRASLQRIQNQTHDPQIRRSIDQILSEQSR
jgi:hypothetical protein